MRDPAFNMDESKGLNYQAPNPQGELRKHPNRPARVAFGPDLETYIPPRDESPVPSLGHHRSLSSGERKQTALARPTSSSGEAAVVSDATTTDSPSNHVSSSERPKPTLKRAKSDSGQRPEPGKILGNDNGDNGDLAMRHGWQEEYTSIEYLKILHSVSVGWRNSATILSTMYGPGSDSSRISTCTSRRNVMKRIAFPETRLETGQVRTGA